MEDTLTAKEYKALEESEQAKYEKKGAKYVLKQSDQDEESSEEQPPEEADQPVQPQGVKRIKGKKHRDLVKESHLIRREGKIK
jgi:hypothetical protein